MRVLLGVFPCRREHGLIIALVRDLVGNAVYVHERCNAGRDGGLGVVILCELILEVVHLADVVVELGLTRAELIFSGVELSLAVIELGLGGVELSLAVIELGLGGGKLDLAVGDLLLGRGYLGVCLGELSLSVLILPYRVL